MGRLVRRCACFIIYLQTHVADPHFAAAPFRRPPALKEPSASSREDVKPIRLPQAIAHRGYKAAFPENSMAAFRSAVEIGAHAIETDLHLSKDGVVVLSHVSPCCSGWLLVDSVRRRCICEANRRRCVKLRANLADTAHRQRMPH